MKRTIFGLWLFFQCLLSAQSVKELRGVWITNVDSYVLNYDADITKAVNYLASMNVNVIFPVMWNGGYTLYPSRVMTQLFNRPISPVMSGRDPLKRLIIEAHRHGIEVIPWMEYGFATSHVTNGNVSGDSILKRRPSWASKTNTGGYCIDGSNGNGFVWMSGINPEVQDFLISLCTEMLDNYEIDGIQGDDRLPALPTVGGYDSVTVAIYKAENNGAVPPNNNADAGWKRWRADKLNQFLARLRDSIKTRNQNLILSSAPSPYYWGYDHHLQDSKTWVNNGMVDNFIPQIYPDPPARSFATYQYILQRTLADIAPSKKSILFPGVLAKVGSYVIPKSQIVECVKENRRNGLMGETYFFYEGIANTNQANGDTLRNSVYAQPALLPFRTENIWRPKATIVNEDDSSFIQLTGQWKIARSTALGFKPNIYYSNDTGYTAINYSMDVPFDAWFGVYAWVEPNNNYANAVCYKIFTGNDSITVYIDQTQQKNKGWYKLADVQLKKGIRPVVKIDNTGIPKGVYLMADAVMIMINRKLSPDVIVSGVADKSHGVSGKPQSYLLENNYPNPFNPTTTIKYHIPEAAKVSLNIYDILGRKVDTLFSGEQPSGSYEMQFDIKDRPSGVYFYQLQANRYTQTKKMLVLK